jgi:transposase
MVSAMVSKATAAAAAQTVQLPGGASAAVLIAGMAHQLLDLDRQVKDTTRLITERFRTCPQAAIIESLPGIGSVLGAEFLVATGGNLAAFATSGHLAAYAGLVPVPQDSGRVTGNLRRPQRTTGDCATSSTWPRFPASTPTDRPGPSTSASAANG